MGCVSSKLFRKELEKETEATNNGVGDNNNNNDPNHIVSLTSTTYGLLNLEKHQQQTVVSAEIEEEVHRSSPPRETNPEVINAWELMEGLEEQEEEESPKPIKKKNPKSTAIDARSPLKLRNPIGAPRQSKTYGGKENKTNQTTTYYTPRPILRPRNRVGNSSKSPRKAVVSLNFVENKKNTKKKELLNSGFFGQKCPPGGENAVVIYATTLRGIRKTFEDCNRVKSVISSHSVRVIERDVSMDSGFREELRRLTGTTEVRVPMVFVKGRFLGGADEVIKLEEEGKLRILFEGVARALSGGGGAGCGRCGGVRFAVCGGCNGSCNVFDEEKKKKVRCGLCNENGLVKCSFCC